MIILFYTQLGIRGGKTMKNGKASRYPNIFFSVIFIILGIFSHCADSSKTSFRRLKNYIDTIKVVNTHEHQRWYADHDGHDFNFYTLVAHSYLQNDLVSAGALPIKIADVNEGNLDALWDAYGRYLDYSRNTSYYSHFLQGFQILYGYDYPCFTEEGIRNLSAQIAQNYKNRDAWYAEAFEKAGFETMFVDQYWAPFNTELNPRYFTLVFNINNLVSATTQRTMKYREDVPLSVSLFKLADHEGYVIQTLDDYLAFADHLFQKFLEHNVVCLKNSMAYGRSLYYEDVPYETAQALFSRDSASLSQEERKALEDFMFHWICKKSIEYDLPIQIHTGYLAGNGNSLERSQPIKLNNLFLKYKEARFSLFHGAFPWVGEFAAFGKMFPNVFLDLVWLPQISRETAVRGLEEMLDCVPYNKFFWGGDCHYIEETTGSLEFGKSVVAEVLANRLERGLMTDEVAKDVARNIFRDNAIRFFKLQEKRNIGN
jgi:predicted TIM-barrel fold metal-dependent hydrolase